MSFTIKITDIRKDAGSIGLRLSMAEARSIARQAYVCANEMINDRLNEMIEAEKRRIAKRRITR